MSDSSVGQMSSAALEDLLRKYCTEHSARRLNYIYWNLTDHKDMTLNFVNLTGKELNRINNGDLVYRIVKIKNTIDWNNLANFFNTHIVDPTDHKAVYVIRIDFLISYLKSIGFDLSRFKLERGGFGTAYVDDGDQTKRKPICTVDNDVQSLYLIDRLYQKYRKMMTGEVHDGEIKDITDQYLQDPKFKYSIDDLNLTLPVIDALDVVSRKVVSRYRNTDPTCRLEQVYVRNGLSTIVSRLICGDFNILTVRVYIQLFLKKYNKGHKK
jgi:hypothetical protein